jgi:GNAT superfamily N-acetyltransferase
MVISSILSPGDCTPQALADFEKLLVAAGTVDPEGVTHRIRKAYQLLFLRESNGQLVGIGALKRPLSSYRAKVFAKAGISILSDEYPVELGWVAVRRSHQGRGFSRRIISQLISLVENENLFATTMHERNPLRLNTVSKPPVSPIRAAAATILFSMFVT